MMDLMRHLWSEEQKQDRIEYRLLEALVARVSAALLLMAGGNIQGIWWFGNSQWFAAHWAAG